MDFESLLNEKILDSTPISGGDIGSSFKVTTANSIYFIKHYRTPGIAEEESRGLAAMRSTRTVSVPAVITANAHILVLEFIEQVPRMGTFQKQLGRKLAEMHKTTKPRYGFSEDNHVGATPQKNSWKETWLEFYTENRLDYQIRLAGDREISKSYEALRPRLTGIIGPSGKEPPCLIHGDLWAGNVISGPSGEPVLIDPAVCYGHRELELAMTRLFGGFTREFYHTYNETFPLHPGWQNRQKIYTLYHVLNHFNLFGGSYKHQALDLMRSFL